MEGTPEFAISLQTAMLTLSGGGGRGEPPSLTVSMATLPGPSKEAWGEPSHVSWLWGETDCEQVLFPIVSGGISEGPFPVWTQTETHRHRGKW